MKQIKFLYAETEINAFLKKPEVYNPEFHLAGKANGYMVMIVYETEPGYREAAR